MDERTLEFEIIEPDGDTLGSSLAAVVGGSSDTKEELLEEGTTTAGTFNDDLVVRNRTSMGQLERARSEGEAEVVASSSANDSHPQKNDQLVDKRLSISRTGLVELDSEHISMTKTVGDGHFGKVYKGVWCGPPTAFINEDEAVAVKVPRHHIKGNLRDNREAKILAQLSHRNIVRFHGIAWQDDRPCLVTEFCDRGSLKQCLLRGESTEFSLPWARDIANGMAYLHHGAASFPIVHRDLKSLNVLVTDDNVLKICDFGSSSFFHVSDGMKTQTGTPAWMAPEMIRKDEDKLSEKCDIWSYGVILWELLTREHPFSGQEELQVLWLVGCEKLRLPTTEIPEHFEKLLDSCWEFDPAKRPSFLNIQKALQQDSLEETMASFLDCKEDWKPIMEQELENDLKEAQKRADEAVDLANSLKTRLNEAQADVQRLRRMYDLGLTGLFIILPIVLIMLSGDGLDNVRVSAASRVFKANAGSDSHLSAPELSSALSALIEAGHLSQDVALDAHRILSAYNWNADDGGEGLDESEFSAAISQETSYVGSARRWVSRFCQNIFGTRLGSLGSLLREVKLMLGAGLLFLVGATLLGGGTMGLFGLENVPLTTNEFMYKSVLFGFFMFCGSLCVSTAFMDNISGFTAVRNAELLLATMSVVVTMARPKMRSLTSSSSSSMTSDSGVSIGGNTNQTTTNSNDSSKDSTRADSIAPSTPSRPSSSRQSSPIRERRTGKKIRFDIPSPSSPYSPEMVRKRSSSY